MPEFYYSGVIPVGFSDQSTILGVRKLHREKRPPPKFIQARNFKNFDSKLFKDDLNHVPWDFVGMEEEPEECFQKRVHAPVLK